MSARVETRGTARYSPHTKTLLRRSTVVLGLVLLTVTGVLVPAHAADGTTTCRPQLPGVEAQHIAALSAPSANRTLVDAQSNVHQIADIWGDQGDPRGAFADVYAPILDTTVPSIRQGVYTNSEWARRLALNFVNRYLASVHAHATGADVPREWQRYYQYATDCRHSGGRVATSGMNSHLILDLPTALDAVDTSRQRWADFNLYGEILGKATPQIVASIKADYGTDLSELFTASIVGDTIGEERATGLFFQSVRAAAWVSGRGLAEPATTAATHAAMWAEWLTAEGVLDTSDAIGLF